jgi:mycothiol synthase
MNTICFSEEFLKPVAKLCRQNMNKDTMPDFLLREKTFGESNYNDKLTLVTLNNEGEVIGFIQGVIKERESESVGYVKLLCVDSNYRRKGVATTLYSKVEEQIKNEGAKKIRVYESYPNYYMPGVDPFYTEAICFFERNGFKKFGDTSNLVTDLVANDFSTKEEEKKLEGEGIVCRRAKAEDKDTVLSWIDRNFAAWRGEVTEAFKNNPITLFITEVNGEIKAFSAHEVNNRGTGWFGPMGTDKSLRGKGIGGILLRKCLTDMRELGFVKAIIPWVGPIPFYMHYSNAHMDRVFWRYEKQL